MKNLIFVFLTGVVTSAFFLSSGCAEQRAASEAQPEVVALPFSDIRQLTHLHGRLVRIEQPLTVVDTYNLHRFGDLTLASERLFAPTNRYLPGSEQAKQVARNNALNQIRLLDQSEQEYPQQIIYPPPQLAADNTVRVGDQVISLTGVLSVSGQQVSLLPTSAPQFVRTNPRPAVPLASDSDLRIASLNVLNLFNGNGEGGAFPTPRGADNLQEYQRQLTKLVTAITAMDAHVIGLMEVENDGFTEHSAIAQLTAALNQASGDARYAFVDAGMPLGDDDIAVGLLYQPQHVSLASAAYMNNSEVFDRPPLAQRFLHRRSDSAFTVVVNHFKSKGSCHKAQGLDKDQEDGQGCFNAKRVAQADTLINWLAAEPELADRHLVLGDLNAYAMEDPIRLLTGEGYTDLVGKYSEAQPYSYVYRGQSGYIDHALASPSMVKHVTDTRIWHINADEPRALDYNTENKTPDQLKALYAADSYRVSDHDPVLISIKFD
ncbi:ExeM/NucH family extracellular endonuclease [Lacimicrobium sp. SS2-24]|uniref:ExeM/NucH family extracellular endonuclease n=1 Tax=Lacimicrobium sp. SS2-24 TaxID=2005569 RepID=UPI000B4ADFEF|nr:ExeM/NucH family extracellular endonuclease [Lacimicrobium sp. SS2-24]